MKATVEAVFLRKRTHGLDGAPRGFAAGESHAGQLRAHTHTTAQRDTRTRARTDGHMDGGTEGEREDHTYVHACTDTSMHA